MKIIIYLFNNFYKVIILTFILLASGTQGFTDSSLTLDEKIGQLFIIPACQLREADHFEDLARLIQEQKIGGILLKQGTAEGQRKLIHRLQNLASIPLLCVQDGEWGVGMRLNDGIQFPRNLTLGAVQDFSLLYQLGQEIGRQCRLVGVHLNLAPVCDVNCNPQNPIIHTRSFGEDPLQVALRSQCVMSGMQSMGVFACAKHFPGHGDTSTDSHVDLPVIKHDLQRLQTVELFPFRHLIQNGVKAVMSAHLCVEAVVEESLLPATFSRRLLTDLLQGQLGFTGLIITDALNMKALTKRYSPEQIAVKALIAGHDLLLYGDHIAPNIDQILRDDVPRAIAAIKAAVESGEIPEIDTKVDKILKAKQKIQEMEGVENVIEKINSPEAYALKRRLFEEAITVVRNEGILPLGGKKIALIDWGDTPAFANKLGADQFSFNDPELFEKVKEYSCLVLSLSKTEEQILQRFSHCGIPAVAVVFSSPYSLSKIPLFDAIVVAYENQTEAQEAAADILLGKLSPKGKLSVSVANFHRGTGLCYE